MTNEQFEREKLYQSSLTAAQTMLHRGLIDEDELLIIDTILLRKYRPLLGILSAGKSPETLDFIAFASDV